MNSYLFLQQIRFGNGLKVAIDMPTEEGLVAPLAVQMLFENAIKHNVISEVQPLHIWLYKEANLLCVKNNLQPKHILTEDSSGLGLENIRKRYTFLSSKEIVILEDKDYYTVKLPLISEIA